MSCLGHVRPELHTATHVLEAAVWAPQISSIAAAAAGVSHKGPVRSDSDVRVIGHVLGA